MCSESPTGLSLDLRRAEAVRAAVPDDFFLNGLRQALEGVRRRRAAGELAFLDLADDRDSLKRATELADRFRGEGVVEDVVVLGIGGSALGARALGDAILGPAWNGLDRSRRRGRPRLHVVDNPDSDSIGPLLARTDPRTTVFNVVSKSGDTVETLALYLVARAAAAEKLEADASRRFVFTTSPERGTLRRIASREGIATLPVPPAVGGRFSALSAVGLFPLALAGVDASALLAGASAAARLFLSEGAASPPAQLAAYLHQADAVLGRSVVAFMPYGDRLTACGRFFQQLWAESLGKSSDLGPTPLAASGPADQHSLLQLLVEGPRDKFVVFLETRARLDSGSRSGGLRIPDLHPGEEATKRLAGRSLDELVAIELRATAEALAGIGCPNATIALDGCGERSLGAFAMLIQLATVVAGELYGVDPFGQPGVEEVKRLVSKSLKGRPGA